MSSRTKNKSSESKGKKSDKDIQAEHQSVLNGLLQREENKFCADCNCRDPRWASWNLGVFLCIRCAGIHRNLGVHISRVKSVNLDSWTPEQMQSICSAGNAAARSMYEASLPENFPRPQTDYGMEVLIRAKYEQKKYVIREKSLNTSAAQSQSTAPSVTSATSCGVQSEHVRSSSTVISSSSKKSSKHRRKASSGLLDSSPNSKHRSANKNTNNNSEGGKDADSKSVDSLLLGITRPAAASDDDTDDDVGTSATSAIQLLSLDDDSVKTTTCGRSVKSSAQNLTQANPATLNADLLSLNEPCSNSGVGSQSLTFDLTLNPSNSSHSSSISSSHIDDPLTGQGNASKGEDLNSRSAASTDILLLYNRTPANNGNTSAKSTKLSILSAAANSNCNVDFNWSVPLGSSESAAVIGQTLCHSLWQ